MLIRSISLFLAAVLFVGFFLPSSSLAMAQLQQQQQQEQQQTTTTTTTLPPSSSLSITTIPPLTPEEQEQQNRLQGVIAATTRDLNETEKQVSGVVFTPRWSEPIVWVNANSIAVLIAYCLPGEFADSGQEILGGFGLEVLESYAIALPQGFMAWMAVVGNQADDVQQNGRRLPAALGVICASDLNNTESRILSPQEQQQINNINQQFTTIKNTQITNIDQVINIIENVTTPTPTQNETGGGGMIPPPLTNDTGGNDTGGAAEQPLRIEVIPNATEAYAPATIKFDTKVTGGIPPYSYGWGYNVKFVIVSGSAYSSLEWKFHDPGIHTFVGFVLDTYDRMAYDIVQIVVKERPPPRGSSLGEGVLDNATVAGEGRGGETSSREGGGITTLEPTEEQPGGVAPTNDTGAAASSATEPPLMAQAIANATQAVAPATIRFDANITGGAPPYSYSWSVPDLGMIDQDRSITQMFFEPGTFTYGLTVTDSRGKVVTDNVQIVISERGLPTEGIVSPEPGGIAPPPLEGGGVSPGVPEGGEGEEPEGGVSPPSTTEEQGGEEPPAPPPSSDDTGEEGEGTPPSTTTEEEPTTPPEGGG